MTSATLSILGIYLVDNSIFEDMLVPSGVEKQIVIDGILQDCSELEILYPNPDYMREMISIWSKRELPTWTRVYNSEIAEYDPIENYNRIQDDTRNIKHSGKDTSSGTTTSESDSTHKYASFDSGNLVNQAQDIYSGEGGTSSELIHGENVDDTFASRSHGNIGVTTSQQMLESELELAPKINTINYIISSFKMRFCLLIY